MNKKVMILSAIVAALVLLTACGSNNSWENEEVTVVSDRLMADTVKAEWTIENGEAGKDALIRIAVENKDGEPIEAFDLNHEKLLHLMVISKDLSYFNHIHPEHVGGGVFEIRNVFPAGGDYRLIADLKPAGGDAMTKMEWVSIEGAEAEAVPVTPNLEPQTAGGTNVKLSIDKLGVKQETTLRFAMTDEQSGRLVTDLEPYLGAIGHVVVLSEDGERYVHVHAEEGQGAGPVAVFETEFPSSGLYKIWGQFQRQGEVFTVSYVVNVQ
ncbi:hypothetical protein D3P08_24010 [Paenibacillus nanensis]|uniref:YtkA-like domain-containing protein n=1 Tax=Paenibacillus nanensis TaxID=393251 RepID=A0A3A1UM58_9BACL|nr:hypothetical protein [Paenibacillus nanensis]RIX48762.1 hypothetical protein D3P08_24010 [Paenibacillus nanensis]